MSHLSSETSFIYKGIIGYHRFMKTIDSSKLLKSHPEIERKLKIINFFAKHGLSAAQDAFNVSRSSIFLWKKKLKSSDGKLFSLRNLSRKPHNTRRMYIEPAILQFIEDIRKEYPRLSKDKLKPLLDEFCQTNGHQTLSNSTIGKVIKRNCYFFYLKPRRKGKRKLKKRLFGYEVDHVGDLSQLDSIAKFQDGLKRYIFTSIDITGRFAFAYGYSSLSSKRGADFINKYTEVAPFAIKAGQTDNGLEFADKADQLMQEKGIVHFFTYPKSPKMNAYIERFNRTLQEEFIDHHEALLFYDLNAFNSALMDYLLFYNTKRIHIGLNNQTPMNYIIKKSNMYATHTLLDTLSSLLYNVGGDLL